MCNFDAQGPLAAEYGMSREEVEDMVSKERGSGLTGGEALRESLAHLISPNTFKRDAKVSQAVELMEGLGLSLEEQQAAVTAAAQLQAVGVTEELFSIFVKLAASRRITNQELMQLGQQGFRLDFSPDFGRIIPKSQGQDK